MENMWIIDSENRWTKKKRWENKTDQRDNSWEFSKKYEKYKAINSGTVRK